MSEPLAGQTGRHPFGAARLKTVVLVCGAALMALEMAGVRLVEPYFGSTVYVWGSIIGIFLGALSLGYYLGGLLADRHPRLEVLGTIILAAAALTFLIPFLAAPLCQALADTEGLDPRIRAVAGSLALYALPSVLMGMVSPFAVRLAARSVARLGHVAGSLYALSTLGSILGTFLVAFVLVEVIGSKTTVWTVGGALLAMSLLCLFDRFRPGRAGAVAAGALLAAFSFGEARTADVPAIFEDQAVLESTESVYHTIHMIDGPSYLVPGRKARYMVFNNLLESGVLLEDDGTLPADALETACGYTRLLHLGVLFTERAPRRVLVIGCGGGIGPQAFAHDYAGAIERVDVIDIDAAVFRLARRWFAFPAPGAHPVIRAHVDDGRLYLRRTDASWDYMIMDAYTAGGRIPRHLVTREFFALAASRLAPGGVLLANIISGTSGETSRLYRAVYRTMRAVFGDGAVYAFPKRGRGPRAQNIMLVAAPGRPRLNPAEIRQRFARLRGDLLEQPDLDWSVRNVQTVVPDFTGAPLLTDDFCPTDSMVYE